MIDRGVMNIAMDMIDKFGAEEAWSMANGRLLARICTGNNMEAEFWAALDSMIWDMSRVSLAERRESAMASAA